MVLLLKAKLVHKLLMTVIVLFIRQKKVRSTIKLVENAVDVLEDQLEFKTQILEPKTKIIMIVKDIQCIHSCATMTIVMMTLMQVQCALHVAEDKTLISNA